jgi:hypothetical protein
MTASTRRLVDVAARGGELFLDHAIASRGVIVRGDGVRRETASGLGIQQGGLEHKPNANRVTQVAFHPKRHTGPTMQKTNTRRPGIRQVRQSAGLVPARLAAVQKPNLVGVVITRLIYFL